MNLDPMMMTGSSQDVVSEMSETFGTSRPFLPLLSENNLEAVGSTSFCTTCKTTMHNRYVAYTLALTIKMLVLVDKIVSLISSVSLSHHLGIGMEGKERGVLNDE